MNTNIEHKNRFLFIMLMGGLIMLLALFGMTACTPPEGAKISKLTEDELYFENKDGTYYSLSITKFEYDGHDYIKFGSHDCQTIVHDPNCHCHQNTYSSPVETEYDYSF